MFQPMGARGQSKPRSQVWGKPVRKIGPPSLPALTTFLLGLCSFCSVTERPPWATWPPRGRRRRHLGLCKSITKCERGLGEGWGVDGGIIRPLPAGWGLGFWWSGPGKSRAGSVRQLTSFCWSLFFSQSLHPGGVKMAD